ncbi:MAG: hypothetical protein AAF705_05415, partial [Bacteroidota bacterium]
MGVDLDLYVADGSITSPYLSKAFKNELIFEFYYLKLGAFLNKEEIKIVSPNSQGEITIGEQKPLKR